jgi:uncharacterized protein DUF6527
LIRLTDLNPTLEDAGGGAFYLEFACPAHGVGHMEYADPAADPPFEGFPDVIRIKIAPPIEAQTPQVWGWNGETDFNKLTIKPSVDYKGHWHGHVINGEVTP